MTRGVSRSPNHPQKSPSGTWKIEKKRTKKKWSKFTKITIYNASVSKLMIFEEVNLHPLLFRSSTSSTDAPGNVPGYDTTYNSLFNTWETQGSHKMSSHFLLHKYWCYYSIWLFTLLSKYFTTREYSRDVHLCLNKMVKKSQPWAARGMI